MHIFPLNRTGWLAATLLTLLVGCKKSNDTVTPANQACQLQSDLTVDSDGGRSATTYTYNGTGQLTSSVVSSTEAGASTGTSVTSTYTYDTAGNLANATTRGSTGTRTTAYEYTGGRLTKQTSQVGGTLQSTNTYGYNGSGQVSTYTDTRYYGSQSVVESYTFTDGTLTSGAITSGTLSATVIVANGRIASVAYPGGSRYRYTYDAAGYTTRIDELNAASVVQSYQVYEYGTTTYLTPNPTSAVMPTINLYGNSTLPVTRLIIYNGSGTLLEEYGLQYQGNSRNYLTSVRQSYNSPTNGQSTTTATYAYSNCQ